MACKFDKFSGYYTRPIEITVITRTYSKISVLKLIEIKTDQIKLNAITTLSNSFLLMNFGTKLSKVGETVTSKKFR